MSDVEEKSVQTDITADLDAAVSETETPESSTEEEVEETVVKATEKPERSKSKKGASNRIQELVATNKDLEAEIEKLTGTMAERDEEVGKLVDLLKLRDNDAAVVAAINSVYNAKPEMRPLIEAVDRLVKGEEFDLSDLNLEKVGKSKVNKEETESEALAKAQKLVQDAKAEMDESLANQADELILHKADLLTDAYIDALPESYNEEDKFILRSVLVDHINWDAIEENANVLNDAFEEGFQNALNWYGTPKGGVQTAEPKGEETESKGAEPITPEKLKAFANQDWGKMKTITTPDGKSMLAPEISDADVSKAMAQVMRAELEQSGR